MILNLQIAACWRSWLSLVLQTFTIIWFHSFMCQWVARVECTCFSELRMAENDEECIENLPYCQKLRLDCQCAVWLSRPMIYKYINAGLYAVNSLCGLGFQGSASLRLCPLIPAVHNYKYLITPISGWFPYLAGIFPSNFQVTQVKVKFT